jgi:hypothetical protein
MIAVPVALALIFMLLYFTFSSVKQATLIYTAIPMSAIGGVFALIIRDMPFSISAGIGFIALFGVAVLNGIVLIGTFNQLEKDGITDILQRIKEGTKIRLSAGVNDSDRCIIRFFTNGTFTWCRSRSTKTFGNCCNRWINYRHIFDSFCFAFVISFLSLKQEHAKSLIFLQ